MRHANSPTFIIFIGVVALACGEPALADQSADSPDAHPLPTFVVKRVELPVSQYPEADSVSPALDLRWGCSPCLSQDCCRNQ